MAVNIFIITIFGAKLVTVFGLTTNAGNVFYACVFLGTHFFIERYGKQAALNSIWLVVSFTLFFVALTQLAVHYIGNPASDNVNNAVSTLFSFSLRVTAGSIIAFIFAQFANISVYDWINTKTKGKFLWLRSNGANILSQLIDSILFFSIVFFDLPGQLLIQAILAGWLIKSLVVLIGTPFLYLDQKYK